MLTSRKRIQTFKMAIILTLVLVFMWIGNTVYAETTEKSKESISKSTTVSVKQAKSKAKDESRPDIVTAVKAASEKDCGCGKCAAKGCEPCHGQNCYYCAAKSLVANEYGCGSCDAKGCQICGPGCDVCKFHLASVAEQKTKSKKSPEKKMN